MKARGSLESFLFVFQLASVCPEFLALKIKNTWRLKVNSKRANEIYHTSFERLNVVVSR